MDANGGFAEAQKIKNLVVCPKVGGLDDDFIGTDEVFAKDGFVGKAGGTKMNPVGYLLRRELSADPLLKLSAIGTQKFERQPADCGGNRS